METSFVCSAASHLGSSLTLDLSSALSVAERSITNWKPIPDPVQLWNAHPGLGSLQHGFSKIRFCAEGSGMRLQS